VKMSDLLYDEPAGPERPSAAAASERNVQRENWMLAPPIGLTSGRPKESPLPPAKNDPDEIHVSSRELNPQLRQLLRPPSDDSTSTNPVPPDPSKRPRPVGDGGASWRAKALKRAKEQAATEGRALDDVVEERWGSLTDLRGSARDTQRRQGGYRGEREYAQHAGARMRRPEDDRDRRMDSRDERNHQEERNYARTQRPDVSRSSDVREKRDPGGGRSERRDIQPSGSQQRQKSDLDKAIGARIQKEQGGRQEEHSTDRPNDIRHERNESDQQQASQPARKSKVDLDKAIQARIQKEQEKRSQGQGESAANDKKKVVTISEFDEHGRPIATSSNQSEGRIGVQRGKYFEDDNADLSTLVRREKEGALHNYDRAFAGRIAHNGKFEGREGDEYDGGMMEGFGEGVARKNKKQRQGQGMQNVDRDRNRAIAVTSRIQTQMERCTLCFDNPNKARHLIVAIGEKVYLCVPKTGALVKGHCMIVPMAHTKATTDLDEDVWDEIQVREDDPSLTSLSQCFVFPSIAPAPGETYVRHSDERSSGCMEVRGVEGYTWRQSYSFERTNIHLSRQFRCPTTLLMMPPCISRKQSWKRMRSGLRTRSFWTRGPVIYGAPSQKAFPTSTLGLARGVALPILLRMRTSFLGILAGKCWLAC